MARETGRTSGKRLLLASLVAVIFAVGALPPGTALAGALDQQQNDASGPGTTVDVTQSLAQTFTAGLGGGLDQVDLELRRSAGVPTAPLIVEIRDVSGSTPGTTILASHSLPASAVTSLTGAFVPISFATPAPVSAGLRYAIVAYSATTGGNLYAWGGSPAATNPYAGGAAFFVSNSPPTGSWTSVGTRDLAFKTYVTPPADKTPPETVIGSKKINGTTAKFTFTSTEPGSSFQCKLDKRKFKPCSSPKKYKRLSAGKHKFKVRAVDASGNIDASPAKKKFKI